MVAAAIVLGLCAIGLSSWEALLTRNSPGAHWSVALLGVGAVVATIVLGWHRQRQTIGAWLSKTVDIGCRWRVRPRTTAVSTLIWSVLIGAVIGWDLFSFVVQSSSFPTLSILIGHVTRYRIGRGLVFALWLVAGSYLVAGWRARTPE
jgi:hypothetical protein